MDSSPRRERTPPPRPVTPPRRQSVPRRESDCSARRGLDRLGPRDSPHPHGLCRLCWEVGALSHTVVANGHALSESERTEFAFAVAVVRERLLARVAVRQAGLLSRFGDRGAGAPSA